MCGPEQAIRYTNANGMVYKRRRKTNCRMRVCGSRSGEEPKEAQRVHDGVAMGATCSKPCPSANAAAEYWSLVQA